MSKNPPDWWARAFGICGVLIGLCGLGLTSYNNRWQKEVYEKSLEERIFVQLSGSYYESGPREDNIKSELGVEVVNLSMQPMYLKKVAVQFADRNVVLYDYDPLQINEPLRRLEPGEAASYKTGWGAGEYQSLREDIEKAKGSGIVEVETTKKRFSQTAQINRVTFVSEFPLSGGAFRPKSK